MLTLEFLSTLRIMLVGSESKSNTMLIESLSKIFGEVIVESEFDRALELFHNYNLEHHTIDVAVVDTKIGPNSGFDFVKEIKKINSEIPFIMMSTEENSKELLEAFSLGASNFKVKPFIMKELVHNIQDVCKINYNHAKLKHKSQELRNFMDIVNQVAVVIKTDKACQITQVNFPFVMTSGFDMEEMIGEQFRKVLHPNASEENYTQIKNTLLSGKTWKGNLKSATKDGDTYYTNATILPVFEPDEVTIREFMSIQFIVTDDVFAKQEEKKNLMQQIIQLKTDNTFLQKQMGFLEKAIEMKDVNDLWYFKHQKALEKISALELELRNTRKVSKIMLENIKE